MEHNNDNLILLQRTSIMKLKNKYLKSLATKKPNKTHHRESFRVQAITGRIGLLSNRNFDSYVHTWTSLNSGHFSTSEKKIPNQGITSILGGSVDLSKHLCYFIIRKQ